MLGSVRLGPAMTNGVDWPMTDDERAIRDLVATWTAASQAGDVDAVLGLMTDDVIFIPLAASHSARRHSRPPRKG